MNIKYSVEEKTLRKLVGDGKSFQQASDDLNIPVYAIKYWAKTYDIRSKFCNKHGSEPITKGARFRHYTIIDATAKHDDNGWISYPCQCDCGEVKDVYLSQLRNGKSNSCNVCKVRHRGIGVMPKQTWTRCIIGAKDRNIPFNLTMQEA